MAGVPGFDIQARSGRVDGAPDRDGVRFITDDGEVCAAPAPDRPIVMRPGDRVTAIYLARAGEGLGRCIALENHSRGLWARWNAALEERLPRPARARLWEGAVAVPSILMVGGAWVATQTPFGGMVSMVAWAVTAAFGLAALTLVLLLQRAAMRGEYLRGLVEEERDRLLAERRKTATGVVANSQPAPLRSPA